MGRIPITDVGPVVDCGRRPAKAVPGETFRVTATVFREGHDAVNCNIVLRDPDGQRGPYTPMRPGPPGTDRWYADIAADRPGLWSYTIEAWSDQMATWRHVAGVKIEAAANPPAGQIAQVTGVDVELVLEEGAELFERAARGVPAKHRGALTDVVTALRDSSRPAPARLAAATAPEVAELLRWYPLRDRVTASPRFALQVDRGRALYGGWYELFPRSEGARFDDETQIWQSGTFATAAKRLAAIADMGFDVVYLPPIHPIGTTHRKGKNNTLGTYAGDPGSPWAIGSAEGGHDAIHPDLGTFDDFDAFVAEAHRQGLEVALDLALQCSPDHPWVKEHPEWFTTRPDGSIAYAENPPKKYQDIYPITFDNDPAGIYAEVVRIIRLWISHGVRAFRVDNPHTKPLDFWEYVLADIRKTDPDVIFLSEAFTRPAMLQGLAKIGFHQSYTYFTWRNSKEELESYLRELVMETVHFLRPNLFVNTPDILHAYLQYGGRPAFKIRAVLAAMASPTWGVYSGFELYEHVAVRPGSEEYLDSEKYQYKPRDWSQPDTLAPYLTRLNEIRRAHPALHELRNLRFHHADNDAIIVFSKRLSGVREGGRPPRHLTSGVQEEGRPPRHLTSGVQEGGRPPRHLTRWQARGGSTGSEDIILVVVNLDPHGSREATVSLDMPELGMDWHDSFVVRDELTGATYWWRQHNYVRLDPFVEPAHVFTVSRNGV
jgi:starch synthase (maltosyl-transferring)